MATVDLEQKLCGISELPAFPLVLRQLQKLIRNPNSNMNQIAMVIAKDPALASRTIRLVNSAYYGLRNRVVSISQAIVILGLNTLNNLMIGLSVIKMFKNAKGTPVFDYTAFWEHAFGAGLISKALAQRMGNADPETCFIAGLLHDMGRLVMEQYLHGDFMQAYTMARNDSISLTQCETLSLGYNHCDVGGYLTQKWEIPSDLMMPIYYHHSINDIPPDLDKHRPVAMLVNLADWFCHKESVGNSGETLIPATPYWNAFPISQNEIQEIVDNVRKEISSTLREWNSL